MTVGSRPSPFPGSKDGSRGQGVLGPRLLLTSSVEVLLVFVTGFPTTSPCKPGPVSSPTPRKALVCQQTYFRFSVTWTPPLRETPPRGTESPLPPSFHSTFQGLPVPHNLNDTKTKIETELDTSSVDGGKRRLLSRRGSYCVYGFLSRRHLSGRPLPSMGGRGPHSPVLRGLVGKGSGAERWGHGTGGPGLLDGSVYLVS